MCIKLSEFARKAKKERERERERESGGVGNQRTQFGRTNTFFKVFSFSKCIIK